MFTAWGHLVYRHRWTTLILSLLLFVVSVGALMQGGTLRNTPPAGTESARALKLIQDELPSSRGSSFILVFGSQSLSASDARFHEAVRAALAPLRNDPRIKAIQTPYDAPPAMARALSSPDGKHVVAIVSLRDDVDRARHYYPQLRARIHSATLDVVATDNLASSHDVDRILGADLQRAEQVSLPLALVLLLLVFGTVVAALLPLSVGVLTVVGGLAGVFLLTRVTDVSQYALNIVTLIGLGLAIDYSLFIVNRFREEFARGATVEDSLARTMATAGRAITFSGLTVAIGLSGLLFYQGTFLASLGLAGAIVVMYAIAYALTFLPALLALLGSRVNRWRLPLPRTRVGPGFWRSLALGVMRRPVLVLAVTVPLVLLTASPFLQLRLANSDVRVLPPRAESYRGYILLLQRFPDQAKISINVVVHYPTAQPLTAQRVGALYDLSRRIARLPHVLWVEGPVDLDPTLGRTGYQRLYAGPRDALPPAIREGLRQTVGKDIATLTALTAWPATGDEARAIVRAIRAMRSAGDGQMLVTGATAVDMDSIAVIRADTRAAVGYIVVTTYLVLFLLLGSVILPLKAVVTNLLSITTSFGALVWIFQQGHLSSQLNFTPAPIDPTVPVLLFCIVFGLSMDYEVLLLSRMKEAFEQMGDNRQAVAAGLEKSGRLITGAAAIMVGVFLAFALAEVVIIKAIGLGMVIAVTVDATIVRALIVPAAMCLLGDLNWWAPQPLARLYRHLNLGEGALRRYEPLRPDH